jgi:hypothetical protein
MRSLEGGVTPDPPLTRRGVTPGHPHPPSYRVNTVPAQSAGNFFDPLKMAQYAPKMACLDPFWAKKMIIGIRKKISGLFHICEKNGKPRSVTLDPPVHGGGITLGVPPLLPKECFRSCSALGVSLPEGGKKSTKRNLH